MYIGPAMVALFMRFNLANDPEPMYTHIGYNPTTWDPASITASRINAAQAAFWTVAQADMPASVTIGPWHCLIGQDGGPPLRVEGNVTSAAGTASGEPVPQNTALLVKKVGLLTGRKNSGRMFIPGLLEAFVSPSGVISGAALTAWQANVNELMPGGTVPDALFGEETLTGGVARVFHASSVDEDSFAPIASLTVQSLCATQRRRLRR